MINPIYRNLKKTLSYSAIAVCCSYAFISNAEDSVEQRLEKLEKKLQEYQEKEKKPASESKTRFAGLVQMDYNQYNGAYNANNEGKTGSDVFVRRVHLRAFHKANDKLDYVLLLLADDNSTRFFVGFARYQPNNKTEFRVGRIKEDRSLSVQYIGEEMTAERPMVANAFATAFQWGVQGHRLFDHGFRLSAGVFEDKKYAGDKDGRDANYKLELGYNTRGTWSYIQNDSVFHLGASYALRELGKEKIALTERAGIRNATNRLVKAPTLDAANDTTIIMGEIAYQKNAFRIEGEYGTMDVDAVDSSVNDLSFSGYYVTASYFLNGDTHLKYNTKYAKFGRPTDENGIWEVYARYSVLDLVDHNEGTKAEVSMIGTNYYINSNINLQLQYYDAQVSGPDITKSPFTSTTGQTYHDGNAIAARMSYRF